MSDYRLIRIGKHIINPNQVTHAVYQFPWMTRNGEKRPAELKLTLTSVFASWIGPDGREKLTTVSDFVELDGLQAEQTWAYLRKRADDVALETAEVQP